MTNRERALNLLHYKPVDRIPAVHFGYWRELLYEWAAQGHIAKELADRWGDSNDADRALDKLIGWDFDWACTRGANMGLSPAFEAKVLEELPQVVEAVVSHETGTAVLTLNAPVDDALLKKTVEDQGYTVIG